MSTDSASHYHFLLEDGTSCNEKQLASYVVKKKDKPLPFSQEKSKIPVSIFADRFQQEKQKYPFLPVYAGKNNPYDNTIIETESDYDCYLREHTYHMLCEEATVRTVKHHDEILIKERDDLRQKLDDASSLFLSMDDRFNSETSRLHDEFDALTTKYEKDGETHRRTHRRLRIVSLVLLILLLASVIISAVRSPSRSYDEGYAAGRSIQESADADLYGDGYAVGKDAGYNEGYRKGYWEGYADAVERSTGAGDSHGSGTGTHTGTGPTRDTAIANTYIGNTSSKKFHLPTCSYLPDAANQITFDSRDEAIAAGYTPCGHCHP